VSTIVVLAFGAALVAALGYAIDVLRRPRRGRHVSGAVPLVRGVAPLVPIALAATATLVMAPALPTALSAALVWCLSVLALPVTGRFSAWAHSAWSVTASTLALALIWGAWRVAGADLSGFGLVAGALLWVIVAVAAGAALAYGWEVLRAAEVHAAFSGGAAPGWWRPRTAMTLVCLSGVAAAGGLVFLAPTAATPGTRPLAGPSTIPAPTEEAPQEAEPSATTTSSSPTVERPGQTAASRSSRSSIVRTTAPMTSTTTSRTQDRDRTHTRTRNRTSTTESTPRTPSTTSTTTSILDITITPNSTKPTTTKPPRDDG
jgi:hypothetical protein